MTTKFKTQRYLPLLVFVIALAIYMSNIGGVSIYILDEAKNAGCAREMFEKGDLVVPTFNNVLRTDKPPLHYFFMMLSYSIFGVNAFAARFFSAIFGALTILITYLFVRKFKDNRTAFWSSFVLLSSIHLSIQFHLAVPDPYLIFFLTAGILSFYSALKTRKFGYLISLYVAIGLGTLSKGPVAIGLSGLIFLLFMIFSKRFKWNEIKKLRPFTGAALVLLIALPWFIYNGLQTNWEWTEGFFFKHNLGRFTSKMEGHGGNFMITILFVVFGLFPFSAFWVQAFKKAFKNRKDDFILFNLISALSIVGFFTLSQTRLPNYTVPSYPFLAIITAYWLGSIKLKEAKLNASFIAILILSIIIVPGIYFGLKFDPALAHVNYIAFYFLPLPIGMITAFILFKKKRTETALYISGVSGMVVAMVFFIFAFPVIDQQNPVSKSIHLLKNKEVRHFQKFNPSYSFYLQKEVPAIDEQDFGVFFNEYPEGIIISTKRKLENVLLPEELEISFSSRDIMETPTTVFISKKN